MHSDLRVLIIPQDEMIGKLIEQRSPQDNPAHCAGEDGVADSVMMATSRSSFPLSRANGLVPARSSARGSGTTEARAPIMTITRRPA